MSDRRISFVLPHGSRLLAAAVLSCPAVLCAACGANAERPVATATAPVFLDVTAAAGIAHRHERPQLDPVLDNIMPWMSSVGAAAAAGDYDDDGWIDLYVTNSRKGAPNFLYHNNGDGTFDEVAASAGIAGGNGEAGVGMDAIWADFDNDGRLDLYVVRWGHDVLYRNNGDGTFSDVTRERFRRPDGSPGTPWANGNAAVAFDFDLDGRLDLYVGNYFQAIDLWNLSTTLIMHDSFETSRNGGRNFFYRQEPDGSFSEIAVELGLDDPGWTLAVGVADVNNDGWPDIYLANDFGPDQLFYNDGQSGFINVSEQAIGRDTRKGMNVDFGDFNNDGWLDIYVTNITTARYLQEGNMLWRNNGPDADGLTRLMDISPESGTFDGGWGWGGKFLDYDNDGDLDIFTVNGFVSSGEGSYWYDLASWSVLGDEPTDSRNWPPMTDRSFSGYETYRLFRNDGDELFAESAARLGVDSTRDGRGVVCFDYDNDGDIDLFVANQGQPPHLYENRGSGAGHWLTVRLEGDPAVGTNADAIGARVTIVAGGQQQVRERDGGNGYAGQSDPRQHFGLGARTNVELLEVRWPDGGVQYLEDVPVDTAVTIRQDPSQYAARPRVAVGLPQHREPSVTDPQRRVPPIEPGELDRLLVMMEEELWADPDNHGLAHAYRARCADYDKHDRSIAFFRGLVDDRPGEKWPRMEFSVALVDKIPTCGGLAAIVCKGTLARQSLDQLDPLVEADASDWELFYARGMNHLHWPRALRHSDDAVADFSRCLELLRAANQALPPHERIFVLLGDAHAKNKSFSDARRVWRTGLEAFPDSAALRERVALGSDDALLSFVEDRRSLEQPIDTDFSFMASSS